MNTTTDDGIRIVWRDAIENYSKTAENTILADAKKKYGTNKIAVVFEAINNTTTSDVDGIRIDASADIVNPNYQMELAKKYCDENKLLTEVKWEHLVKLDQSINAELEDYLDLTHRYKTVYVKYIELFNFMSYGPEVNIIPYSDLSGITTVHSEPQNFGGKTIAILDGVLFLFFNKTTKTTVAEDIFNENTDCNEVRVRGELMIDGKEYVIERQLKRRKKQDNTWDVRQVLTYYEKLPMGGLRDLKGEERRQTELELKKYVGTYEDFLLTVLTKQDTLEDLIKAKPTERGRTFTRFVGLELFREKDDICKQKQKEWLSTSLLEKHNTAELNQQIDELEANISNLEIMAEGKATTIGLNQTKLKTVEANRDRLMSSKHHDIDQSVVGKNESEVLNGINKLKLAIESKNVSLKQFVSSMIEPDEVYDLDQYNILIKLQLVLTNEVNKLKGRVSYASSKIDDIRNSGQCQFCSNDLSKTVYYVDATEKANNEKSEAEKLLTIKEAELSEVNADIAEMSSTKELWEQYQRHELQRDKFQLEIEKYELSKKRGEDLYGKFKLNRTKLEHNAEVDKELTKVLAEFEILSQQISTDQISLSSYRTQVKNLKNEVQNKQSIIEKVEKDEYINKIYKLYRTIYGKNGISKMVLGTLLPSINANLRELMMDSADFILEMDLNGKNELEYYIIKNSTNMNRRKLGKGSGYEKTISALALRTVLAKFCSLPRPQFVIFDEIFGAVAVDNFELIGAFFDKIKKYFDNIIIISHHPTVQTWCDSTITINKVNEISKIKNIGN